MTPKRIRADSLANEVFRSVQAAVKEAAAAHVPVKRRPRNGGGLPLFAWLRGGKKYAQGSPILHITQQTEPPPRIGALMSKVEAAAQVVRRINRTRPMTATQLQLLHDAITARYGGSDSKRDPNEWVSRSQFAAIYADDWRSRRIEFRLIDGGKINPYAPSGPAVLTSPRLTDALLMAHLYAAMKPGLITYI